MPNHFQKDQSPLIAVSFLFNQCLPSPLNALKKSPMTPSLFPALPTMERSAGLAAVMTMAPLWRNVV